MSLMSLMSFMSLKAETLKVKRGNLAENMEKLARFAASDVFTGEMRSRMASSIDKTIEYSMCGLKVTAFEGHGKNGIKVDHVHFRRVLGRIVALLSVLSLNNEVLEILYVPLPIDRCLHLRKPMEPIGPADLNGGLYVPSRRTIVVYRREEYPKVMLHEVFHHVCAVREWDFGSFGPYELEEAVSETLAVVCHAAMLVADHSQGFNPNYKYSKDSKKHSKGSKCAKEVVNALLDRERAWCDALVAKLSRIYDYPARPWVERTNVFSYLFLRRRLMSRDYMDAFLGLWDALLRGQIEASEFARAVARQLNESDPTETSQQQSHHNNKNRCMSLRMTRYGSL